METALSNGLAGATPPGNVILDVDGCLTIDGQAIPGAGEAVGAVLMSGARMTIATNNSTRTAEALASELGALLGVDISPTAVVTSAVAAVGLLSRADDPVLVVGEEGVRSAIAAAGFAETVDPEAARSVVVGLDRSFDYDVLSAANRAVRRGARLVACNDDATLPTGGGPVPGSGSLLAAVERASGATATVAGKPYRAMVEAVSARLGPGPTWVVGDRGETDVAFARAAGWKAVLVLTGVTRHPDDLRPEHRPDMVIPSIADLPALL